jgi:hypothetical protein
MDNFTQNRDLGAVFPSVYLRRLSAIALGAYLKLSDPEKRFFEVFQQDLENNFRQIDWTALFYILGHKRSVDDPTLTKGVGGVSSCVFFV